LHIIFKVIAQLANLLLASNDMAWHIYALYRVLSSFVAVNVPMILSMCQ